MANISKASGRVTYKQLNQALVTLGFICKETKDFTAYREAEHGAFIVLPHRNTDSEVGDPHLVSVRNTVTGKGIASNDELQALLVSPPRVSSSTDRTQSTSSPNFRKPGKKWYVGSKVSLKKHPAPTTMG
jgi:hypothetical protein